MNNNNDMNTAQINPIKIREEWRALTIQINSQLKRAGKPLSEIEDSEWKNWIIQLIAYRNSLTEKF